MPDVSYNSFYLKSWKQQSHFGKPLNESAVDVEGIIQEKN